MGTRNFEQLNVEKPDSSFIKIFVTKNLLKWYT